MNYYEKDGYYTKMENEGDDIWQGKLKEELKLADIIEKKIFDKIINERTKLAGFDLTFSSPKTMSLAIASDDEICKDMLEIQNTAVKETLKLIEEREIGARITQDKVTEYVRTGNMICGKFQHYVSRNSDPQLHDHCVILNKTKYGDKFYAVDNSNLYKNKIMYGQIYRNILAKELMKKGYEIDVTDPEKGFFELRGVSRETIDQFSTRRQEIVQKMKEWNNHSAEAASKATLLTRQAKKYKDMSVLKQSWQETLNEMSGAQITKSDGPIIPTEDQKKIAFDDAVSRLEKKNFAFTELSLKKAVLASGVGTGMSEEDYTVFLQTEKERLVAFGNFKQASDGEIYYTTKKNLQTEKEIFVEVAQTKNSIKAMKPVEIQKILTQALGKDNAELSTEQRQAVTHIATTRDQYTAIQGLAGTGKTHMLNYARQVLESDGYTVTGACYTGKAAEGLQTDAHIPSSTIHSLLNRMEREAGNWKFPAPGEDLQSKTEWNFIGLTSSQQKEAWVVDEASLVDNSTLRHVMEAARLKNAKVILVGDRQQLLPVGVGNAFATLTELNKIGTVKLTEIRRQKNNELLKAVREAVGGDIKKSLDILEKDTVIIGKLKARLKAIVGDYTDLSIDEQKKTIILTAANKDRHTLNDSIRKELLKRGQLKPGTEFKTEDATGKKYSREFSLNDKIIFLQNDNKLGVRNGQTGLASKIEGNIITINSNSKEIIINTEQYNKIDHGYAMTAHKAQGITVDRALINLDSSQKQMNTRNAFYVDISRARHQVKIYTDDHKKIADQVKDFAKKIISEDFLIAASASKKGELTPLKVSIKVSKNFIKRKGDLKLPSFGGMVGKEVIGIGIKIAKKIVDDLADFNKPQAQEKIQTANMHKMKF